MTIENHTALVLRTASPYKSTSILLDEQLGKIEVIGTLFKRRSQPLCLGSLISCTLKKKGMRYVLTHSTILAMPDYWVREHFIFFHHVLELCTVFLSFDEQVPEVFDFIKLLYTQPSSFGTHEAQKLFLCHFFKTIGIAVEGEYTTTDAWLLACIQEHPQAAALQTASFLTAGGHE